jgi:uncharacterized protein YbjT (DUF2867 family)
VIFIAGATGFVGGHLLDALAERNEPVKCLVRSQKAAEPLTRRGVETVVGDISSPASLEGVMAAGDFVVHLVGIIEEREKATFQTVHVEGTTNLVAEAKRAGVRHFFYQSALGADARSWSGYLRTKAEAEDIVRKSGLPFTIFRPSLIIGPWDGFTKKLAEMLKLSPVIPIPGEGKAKFQPVAVKDWVKCMLKVIDAPEKFGSTYDIGGPEHLAYARIVETLAAALGIRRPVFRVPMGLMKLSAAVLQSVLSSPPVTSDQLRLLEMDNICDLDAVERHFGFVPMTYADAVKEFVGDKP